MPTQSSTNAINLLFTSAFFLSFVKLAIIVILIFYAIFALMVVRQVDLMGKTLITKVSPILKALAIAHAGFAIGLIILVIFIL